LGASTAEVVLADISPIKLPAKPADTASTALRMESSLCLAGN
jgi:hypothetical protein